MTPTKVFLVVVVSIVVRCVDANGVEDPPTPIQVRSITLTDIPLSKISTIFGMSVTERRELCEKEVKKIATDLGTLTLPLSENYYVPAAQLYYSEGDTQQSRAGVRCPTFPSLYVLENLSTHQVSHTYTVKMQNPYLYYKFEHDSPVSAEEIESSKKDKKQKEEDKEKSTKKKVKDDEEMTEKKKEKKEGEDKLSKEKLAVEDEAEEKQKKKKDKEDEEKEEKRDKNKDKPKEKKDKEKKKEKKDKISPKEHLWQKMINVDAEQRWFLCNGARKLIQYVVDPATYTGNDDPKIYTFSYFAGPSEDDVAFKCFNSPEIYIRVSRSEAKDTFMISLIENSSLETKRKEGYYKISQQFPK